MDLKIEFKSSLTAREELILKILNEEIGPYKPGYGKKKAAERLAKALEPYESY